MRQARRAPRSLPLARRKAQREWQLVLRRLRLTLRVMQLVLPLALLAQALVQRK